MQYYYIAYFMYVGMPWNLMEPIKFRLASLSFKALCTEQNIFPALKVRVLYFLKMRQIQISPFL